MALSPQADQRAEHAKRETDRLKEQAEQLRKENAAYQEMFGKRDQAIPALEAGKSRKKRKIILQ